MQPLILLLLQRPYVCDYPSCTKHYIDPSSLRKHKNNSHLKKARKDQREHERESRDDGSSGMAHGAEGDMQKVKDPAFHSALKPEAMYYTDSSELPFMKAHTDPGPSVLQRVHNNTGLYFPPFCADGRDYNAYYHEADQKLISTGSSGLALSVIQHSSWASHSTAPHTAEHPHRPHPTLNQLCRCTTTPLQGHLLARTRSNGSSRASNGSVAASPTDSMLSSTSIETAQTNQTYPGTKGQMFDHSTFTQPIRNHSAVSTLGRNHGRHHSHPPMNGSSEQESAWPFQCNLSQGSINHVSPSCHNLLPPLWSNKAPEYNFYDALPSFSDVQVHPAAPWMPTEYSTIDMAHHTHPPECLACQQPPDAPLKLPTRQCALNRVASLNMALADSSTHLMSLPRVSTQQT